MIATHNREAYFVEYEMEGKGHDNKTDLFEWVHVCHLFLQ